ncbi:Annexin [Thozetella sp. PMI_491]|nr:Annexin [Thozetella sp. PMI_491]
MRNFTTTSDECPLPIPAGPSPGYGPPEALNRSGERGAIVLRHAMMGGGADAEALMRTLIDKDPFQVAQIRESFIYLYRRSVEFDINTETEGGFANGLLALIRGPLDNDVQLLDDMKDQPRAKAKVMNDVLLGRSNADLRAIKRAFQQAFNQTLEDVLLSSQFFDAGAHFKIVLGAKRAEESEPVLETSVERDVQAIYDAEERPKPDRTPISIIMSQRNDSQIRAIAERYRQLHARTLEDLFEKHFQGSLQAALLFQLRHAMNKPVHRAMLLAEAIEAIEADWDFQEQLLISRIVRYHWNPNDMRAVRAAFDNLYRRSLSKQLSREPQEAYRRLLLGCIGALPISEEPPASPASDLSAEAWPHPDEHRAPGNIGAAASWDFHLYRVPPPAPPTTGKDVLREPGRLGH